MLSRRYIRIKAMQALYAYFHSEDKKISIQEKALFSSIDKIYELYLSLLLLLIEIRENARELIAIRKIKRLPTAEDITPNTRFVDNRIFGMLSINRQLTGETSKRKISWQNDKEISQKVFSNIKESNEYASYMNSEEKGFSSDKKYIIDLWKQFIIESELLHFFFEEKSIHWADDIDYVNSVVIKTIESLPEDASDNFKIFDLYKDEKEDRIFTRDLFRQVIEFSEECDKEIQAKTENWELDRIAFMDVLLMKMAMVELLHFPTIPVKVTLNEYIELSKQYSTPKSSLFINGILDKLVIEYKNNGKLQKHGRGLVES